MSTSSRMAVGVAAAAVGVGVSQLLSRFVSPTADVMNLMPEPIREWTIQEFGTSARLFVSIMVLEVVAAVAAVIAIEAFPNPAGQLPRRRRGRLRGGAFPAGSTIG